MPEPRVYIQEEMDNFGSQNIILDESLHSLSRINTGLGNTSITLEAIKKVLRNNSNTTFSIVDLGCGGGDNLRAIAAWCFKNDKTVKLMGIDGNCHILEYAKKQRSVIDITYKHGNILDAQFEMVPCDIVISSHFIYRFTDDGLVDFMNSLLKKVSTAIILSELQRSTIPYVAFKIIAKLYSLNTMVTEDGLKAIKSSFKKKELKQVLEQLDVKSYDLRWKWAFRYLVVISV